MAERSRALTRLAAGDAETPSGASSLTLQARKRVALVVSVLSLAVFVACALSLLYYELLGWEAPARLAHTRFRLLGILAISLPMFALARWSRLTAEQVLDLGLGYQVVGALVCSLSFYGPDPVLFDDFTGVTWLGVWILMFPLVAPASFTKSALAALASATTGPLVYVGWVLYDGGDWAAGSLLANTFVPNYFCALLALFPLWLLRGLTHRADDAEQRARELGTYRLVEKLGQGGMGEVWRGEHTLMRRPAAIKLIRTERLQGGEDLERIVSRFEREANATAALKSPHTVELYDFGLTPDGGVFCVMELLDGIDLEVYLKTHGRMRPRRAVHVLLQVCMSLCEAHHVGMVHRDVKPANLYLCRYGLETDFVKVLDFGLVAVQRADARLTADGVVIGSPLYMAPEQAREGGESGPATDLYALGCVAFALLTGEPVFHGDSPIDVLLKHQREAPRAPSTLAPEVSEELDALVLSCLQKDAADRPQGMHALREALLALNEEPWTRAEADAWWASHMPAGAVPAPASQLSATTVELALGPQVSLD